MPDLDPLPQWPSLDRERLLAQIEQAGIRGMGGGGFSTAMKLRLAQQARVTQVIGNAVECEPGISVDAKLLAEHTPQVLEGLRIALHLTGASQGVLAYAADFPSTTLAAIREQFADTPNNLSPSLDSQAIARTPGAGAERALCKQLFDINLAPQEYPIAQGVVCLNAATLLAVQQAIVLGEPLQQRLVTVQGRSQWVALGTRFEALLPRAEQPEPSEPTTYRVGGHYTGKLSNANNQVTASTNAVWLVHQPAASPCTYCSRCSDACPEALAPQVLHRLGVGAAEPGATNGVAQLEAEGLWRCTECGLCNFECPSNIDLLGTLQQAKSNIQAEQSASALAQRAQERHTRHLARTQERAQLALERRADRRAARRSKQRGPDAWR